MKVHILFIFAVVCICSLAAELPPKMVAQCEAAPNCEIVYGAKGEPLSFNLTYSESMKHNLDDILSGNRSKRAGPPTLLVQLGWRRTFSGTTNIARAFEYAVYACGEISCDFGSRPQHGTEWVNHQSRSSAMLYTTSHGMYRGYEMRKLLIDATMTAATQGQYWWDEPYVTYNCYERFGRQICDANWQSLRVGNGVAYISAILFEHHSTGGGIMGSINSEVTFQASGGYECPSWISAVQNVVAAVPVGGPFAAAIISIGCL